MLPMLPRLYYTSQLKGHQEIHVTSLTCVNVLLHHLIFSIGEYVLLMLNNFLIQHVRCIHLLCTAMHSIVQYLKQKEQILYSCHVRDHHLSTDVRDHHLSTDYYIIQTTSHPTPPPHPPYPIPILGILHKQYLQFTSFFEYLFILLMLITNQMQLIKPQ